MAEKSVADRTDEPLDPLALSPADDGQLNALVGLGQKVSGATARSDLQPLATTRTPDVYT